MRTRIVLSTAVLTAVVAAFPLAGVASAQPAAADRECRDFASQAAAQSALRSRSGDPQKLDPNRNGVACEDFFKTADGPVLAAPPPVAAAPAPLRPAPAPLAQPVLDRDPSPRVVVPPPDAPADVPVRTVPEQQILVKPAGAADTGDGSSAPGDTVPLALLAGGLGVAALGAAGVRSGRRSH